MRSEILQSEDIKLYEYDTIKPPLEDIIAHFNHNHDPRNGQFTTGPGGGSGSISTKKDKKRKKKQVYKSNEDALSERDYKYINKHKDQFTTKEMNDLMNRIQTEERMNKFTKDHSTTKKVKDIINNPIVKTIGVAALSYATYQYVTGVKATPKRLPDKSVPYRKQFAKDVTTGAGKAVARQFKKKVPI